MADQAIYAIKLLDLFTGTASKITRSARTATRTFTTLGSSLKKIGYGFTSLRSIISASYGAAMVAFPIKKAAEFEGSLIDIQRIINFKSEDSFRKFREGLIQTGLYLGKTPTEMAKLGYQVSKFVDEADLDVYIKMAARMSRAFDIPAEVAGEQLGKISAKMKLGPTEMGHFLDSVNYVSDRTATSSKNMIEVLSRLAPTMAEYKMPPHLVAGWAAFADQLQATPRLAAKGLEIVFREAASMRGGMRRMFKDPNAFMVSLMEKLEKMKPEKRMKWLDRRGFGVRGMEFLRKMSGSMKLFHKTMGFVEDQSITAGSMLNELNKRLTSAETSLDRIKAVWDIINISIGDIFLPYIKQASPHIIKMAFAFREFVRNHPKLVKIIMGVLALITVLTGATVVIGLVSIALGTLLSPATLILVAVILIASGFVYLYKKSERFRKALSKIKTTLKPVIDIVKDWFSDMTGMDASFEGVFAVLENIAVFVVEKLNDSIIIVIDTIKQLYEWWVKIKDFFTSIGDFFTSGSIRQGTEDFANRIKEIDKKVQNLNAEQLGDFVNESKKTIVSAASEGSKNIISGIIDIYSGKGVVKKAEITNSPSGNVGFNLAESKW